MIQSSSYVFTNIPSSSMIRGGRFADAMAPTHEHWHFINEAVRTLEYGGSVEPRRFGMVYTASTSRDSPVSMAPSRAALDAYWTRANNAAIVPRVTFGSDGIWGRFSDSTMEPGIPYITLKGVRSHLGSQVPQSIFRPDGMSFSLSGANRMMTDYDVGLLNRVKSSPRIVQRNGVFHFNSAQTGFGAFEEFFYSRNVRWTCNGASSGSPESSTQLSITPFMYEAFGQRLGLGAATAYFREKTDDTDLTFSREGDYGYEFASAPWPSSSLAYADFSFVYGMMSASVWKSDSLGQMTYDKTRNAAFVFNSDQVACNGNGSVAWGILSDYTVKQRMESALSFAQSQDNPFDPAEYSEPDVPAEYQSQFRLFGYQLYIWPCAVICRANPLPRDMGEVI